MVILFDSRIIQAGITDTVDDLIIPAGETYSLSGNHTYTNSIEINGTLNVKPYDGNAANGWISLTASSMTVSATGKINADGKGYRGGYGIYSSGEGPGGGKAAPSGGGAGYGGVGGVGRSASWDPIGYGGVTYGSIKTPTDMGSGGGGGNSGSSGGSGGGSVVFIINGQLTIDGSVSVNGSNGSYNYPGKGGGGSGGSILIEAQSLVGTGSISANGGMGGSSYNAGGAGGRVALVAQKDLSSITVSAYAGNNDSERGGAGTIFKKTASQANGDLYLSNNNKTGEISYVSGVFDTFIVEKQGVAISTLSLTASQIIVANNGKYYNAGQLNTSYLTLLKSSTFYHQSNQTNTFGSVQVSSGAVLYVDANLAANNIIIQRGGYITHSRKDADFSLTVNGNLEISAGGSIDVSGKGYSGGDGVTYSNGEGTGGGTAAPNGGGGGYGGTGGTGRSSSWDTIGYGGIAYGSMISPNDFGSGGGVGNGRALGGSGGGKIRLTVNGTLTNDGVICANGLGGGHSGSGSNGGGGGSGGSIYVMANQLNGSGIISANGGNGDMSSCGGGAGGRVAIYYNNSTFSGQTTANAGSGGNPPAQAGTIMTPTVTADSPNSISNADVSYLSDANLSETVLNQSALGMLNAEGTLRGTVNISTLTIVTVKTGAFANKGFYRGSWNATLENINYQGQCYGMVYFNQSERKYYLKGVMEGVIDGALDAILTESMTNSNIYDQLSGAWTFRLTQSGSQISSGKMTVSGTLTYGSQQEYPYTSLYYVQSSAQGTLAGSYTGAINTVLTALRINDTDHPNNGEGFGALNYQWNELSGQAWSYCKAVTNEETDLKLYLGQPLFGTASGLLRISSSGKNMWLVVTKLDIGQEPQADISLNVWGPDSASPGQTVTYTVELRNDGFKSTGDKSLVIFLPSKSNYVSASDEHLSYNLADWDENGEYKPCPVVRWDISEIPTKTIRTLTCQVRLNWGLSQGLALDSELYLLKKEDADQIFPSYVEEGDHD